MHKPIVIRQLAYFKGTGYTKHLAERIARQEAYKDLLSENFIWFFEVTTGHPNGNEVHAINEHGLIYVFNYASGKNVTIMHPRKPQLFRYFEQLHLIIPAKLVTMAYQNEVRNLTRRLNNL